MPEGSNPAVPSVPIDRWATAAAPGEVRLEWQSLFDAFLRRSGWDLSRLLPRWVVEHKTSGDRRCRDETAFVPAKQAIPVARDPVIGPVADTPRQQQEYSRPGPAGQAGKNEDHGVGFEICVAIDNGDVSLGAGDIDGERGRVASADPRVLWIATKRNRALASRSITNRTHQQQSTQTPSNKMSRWGTSSRLRGIHRLLTRSSTDRAYDGQRVRGRRSSRLCCTHKR